MLKRDILAILALISVLFVITLFFVYENDVFWSNNWIRLFYAIILAIIVGFIIEFIYGRYKPKERITENTQTVKPKRMLAKLLLPDENQCYIKEYERTFGREDFLGIIPQNKLLFIGKKHFKIIKMDDGFYIEDLNTKNGTFLNKEDIRGLGKKKLADKDTISVADVLKIKFTLDTNDFNGF